MKWLKRILLATLLVFLISALGLYTFIKSTMPPMDGQLTLTGLSGPVTISRDSFGIPHIKAANRLDAYQALGFFMASERLFQMELSRRLIHGRLSEVFGDKALPIDKLYRTLMLRKSTERMMENERKTGQFDAALWAELEAYFKGVNEFAQTQPLPLEFHLLKIKPEPFTPIDAYMMTGHMAYSFGIAMKADPLMTELAKVVSPSQFQNLRGDALRSPIKIVQQEVFKPFLNQLEGIYAPVFEGSNAWLVGPDRSISGKSLFANDPHIGFSSPSVWTEAHIQTPDFEIYGQYLPLVPFAVLGHNRHRGWGFTMSLMDDMDLYREKLDRKEKTALFKGKSVPYQEWQEIIKVKNGADVTVPFIETSHGPLLDELISQKDLSLKWAYHRLENNPMKSLRLMGQARSMKEFESALQYGTAPGLNVMYADPDNIAWWTFGDIAVKANPHSDMILDGASGQDEYVRLLKWNEKPHLVNPESNVIITANSRPLQLPADIRGDWQPNDRMQTLEEALKGKDLFSIDDFKELQTKNYNTKTRVILHQLLNNLRLTEEEQADFAQELQDLRTWNYHSNVDSTAASLFHLWNNENIRLILRDLENDKREAYLATPYSWLFYRRIIFEPQSEWFKNKDLGTLMTDGFRNVMKKYSSIPVWGKIHTIEFLHPLGRAWPLNYIFNLGPYPIGGNYNEINNNKSQYFGSETFAVFAGASTRRLIDFAAPEKSLGVNPIGISGHLLSPFFKDQVPLFLEGRYRPQLMNDGEIKKAQTHFLTLHPGSSVKVQN